MVHRASKSVSANAARNPLAGMPNIHRIISVNEVARIESESERFAVWGEPKLCLRSVTDSDFRYQLRSRVNTTILSGGPLPYVGDVQRAARSILELCARESSLRIERDRQSFFVALFDEEGRVVGRSDVMETEALARAMIRLIVVQARSASVSMFDGDRVVPPPAEKAESN